MERKDGLIAAAVVAVFVIGGTLLMRSLGGSPSQAPGPGTLQGPKAGSQVELSGIQWARGDRTLVLVLSKGCHFCTESARFYRRLAREAGGKSDVHLVAVLPQEEAVGRAYLHEELRVEIPEVHSAPLDKLGVPGTPTLILVDRAGKVLDSWVGRLPPDREEQVVDRLLGRRTA